MAYERFERTSIRVETPTLSLVPDGRITVNAAACRLLAGAGVKAVALLWDELTHRIAMKAASKSDRDAFAVSMPSGNYSGSLRAKSFLTYIGWNAATRQTIPATWNESEKMLEATLPPGFLKPRPSSRGKPKVRAGIKSTSP
jgi:hypothetical protein